jgi:hypothetical protein
MLFNNFIPVDDLQLKQWYTVYTYSDKKIRAIHKLKCTHIERIQKSTIYEFHDDPSSDFLRLNRYLYQKDYFPGERKYGCWGVRYEI